MICLTARPQHTSPVDSIPFQLSCINRAAIDPRRSDQHLAKLELRLCHGSQRQGARSGELYMGPGLVLKATPKKPSRWCMGVHNTL